MRRMKILLTTCFIIWLAISEVWAADCTLDDRVVDPNEPDFPNIFDQLGDSLSVSVEFNNIAGKESIFLKENYDVTNDNGKLQMWRGGDYKEFYYFNKSKEAITISKYQCSVQDIDIAAPPFLEFSAKRWLDVETEGDKVVRYNLGPSAVMRQGYRSWKKDKSKVAYMGKDKVRGVHCHKWKECDEKTKGTVMYYFSEKDWTNPAGKSMTPIRASYSDDQDTTSSNQLLDYMHFLPYSEVSSTANVPEGYGCQRMVENMVNITDILQTDHYLEGEVIYYSVKNDAKGYNSYVSTFRIAYHKLSDSLSYRYAPWKTGTGTKDKPTKAGDLYTIVWDIKNSIVYKLNEQNRSCEREIAPEFYPSFALPDKGDLDLFHPYLLMNNTGFQYLGSSTERGIPVSIFEQQFKDMKMGERTIPLVVITRYYSLGDKTVIGNTEINSPVRINIALYDDAEKNKMNSVAVINIFSYTSDIPNVQTYFDVRHCYQEFDKSMWFSVYFPIPNGITKSALEARQKEIEKNFLGFLYSHSETSPLRIPRVLVGISDSEIEVSALLLERPEFKVEFDERGTGQITSDYAELYLSSVDECFKACIESQPTCLTVSFCGSSCFISIKAKTETATEPKCKTYDRIFMLTSMPTMDQLSRSIRQLVDSGEFVIGFPINVGDEMQVTSFTAYSFGDSVGNVIPGFVRDKNFQISKTGYKLVLGDGDKFKKYGSLPLQSCKQTCLNNPECETVSFCEFSGACIVTDGYLNDISIDKIVKDTRCIIYGRNYLDSFTNYSGIALSKNADNTLILDSADECAKMCVRMKVFTCRSFDYCKDDKKCMLHTSHFFDLKNSKSKDGAKISDSCSHYSKKFVYDFDMKTNVRIKGDGDLTVRGVGVEECAQKCVENGGFFCAAFDFCEEIEFMDNYCILSSTPDIQADVISKPKCRRFTRDAPLKQEKKSTRYSSGLATGLAFLFLFIGVAIGCVAIYIYGYLRVNRR